MKVEIEILASNDIDKLDGLISVFENVFDMEHFRRPSKAYLQKLLSSDTFLAVIAKTDNEIIGGLTVYLLDQYYAERPLAYIYDLAVLAEYQRNGIGKKLLEFAKAYCGHLGVEELFVQATKDDDQAIHFYRCTKPTKEEDVVHFSYTLRNAMDRD